MIGGLTRASTALITSRSKELVRGGVSRVSQRTPKTCLTVFGQARKQAVILGCTELVMLVDASANALPVYDTTTIHALAVVDRILADEGAAAADWSISESVSVINHRGPPLFRPHAALT